MDTNGWIFGTGPQNAKILICGEMPSKTDESNGRIFSGLGGDLVEEMLETGGVRKEAVYLTNLIKRRCESFDVAEYLPLLLSEIEAVKPNVIIGLGETVLKTLTNKEGIRNYRGSILPCVNVTYPLKVIPTIPPAALFEFKPKIKDGKRNTNAEGMFSFKQKIHIQFDFLKAIKQSAFPEFTTRRRDIRPVRSSLHLEQFLKTYKDYDRAYLDVEVYKAHLVCLGIAFTPDEAISVPLIDLASNFSKRGEGIAMNEMLEIWKILDVFLRSNVGKVGQNFKGDKIYWLEESGFTVNNFIYDAMLKFHTISPELPKSLAFQCSVLTDEPYYKHEGKEYNPHRDRMDILLHYNGMDCCINCECDLAMEEDLIENELEDFFYNFVCPASPIYERMEKRGLRVDLTRRDELSLRYKELLAQKHDEFIAAIGHECNFNSPKQITNLMYVELKLPKRRSVDDQDLTAIKNKIKDQKRKDIIQLVLDQRKLHKIKGTFIDAHVDPDSRMRFTYNQVGTETGRSSTGIIKSPARNAKWGVSLHALPKHGEFGHDVRSMFIPDTGMVFMEFDQSQAEARIVALLANDIELLNLFDTDDVHKLTASYVFGLDKTLIDEEQRQIGKKGRHAVNYRSTAENLAVELSISLYRARLACDKIAEMSPNIINVFHAQIEEALANSRVFITPFGRRREFFDKWGRDLFKEATAHLPQSTVGDNTKRAMIWLDKLEAKWFDILTETHDAFTVQVEESSMEDMYYLSKEAFEQPLDFTRCTLPRDPIIIPVDCKVGYNLTDMKKWKP